MRIRVANITFLVVFVNIIALYYSWRLISKYGNTATPHTVNNNIINKPVTKVINKHISKSVTVILRSFELNENDVTLTVESVLTVFPNIQIYILCNGVPYPPLELMFSNSTSKNVKVVNLALSLNVPFKERFPLLNIKTKYVLFIPDSTRITTRQVVQSMVNEINKHQDTIIAGSFINNKNTQCLNVDLNIKEWTLKYESVKNETCDSISGKHAILVETQLLRKCADPFMLPFPDALYIQTRAQQVKVLLLMENTGCPPKAGHSRDLENYEKYEVKFLKDHLFHNGKPLQRSHHAQWKYKQAEESRRNQMYENFSIKKVIRETGTVEWYGCTRETPRCFGTVVDSMPSYLYMGRWTPPCCLANLRTVARHVFERLDESGVRYWLDGGSLLGAMRNSDILPWDYDVDIGINRDDISRCELLTKAKNKPLVDNKGYVWEKATEGEFFRVQFSKTNRIYVNIFPFFSKNGTMTKDMWFTSHKNMEFPDHFLHPMSSIEFINRHVPSPNNIRDFLELKYGRDVIENPQYPDPKKLKFT